MLDAGVTRGVVLTLVGGDAEVKDVLIEVDFPSRPIRFRVAFADDGLYACDRVGAEPEGNGKAVKTWRPCFSVVHAGREWLRLENEGGSGNATATKGHGCPEGGAIMRGD